MSEQGSAPKRGLGRGLSALMDDFPGEGVGSGRETRPDAMAPIDLLVANRFQPRRLFASADLEELVASIRTHGLLQPILVRPAGETERGEKRYEIVAGERRWRAAQKAGLHEVPIVVRTLEDGEALEIAIIENVQRKDLTPIEEAHAYQRLVEEFSHTQEDVAKAVGKSRSHIANLLRLLSLPPEVRAMLEDGRLSMGHARALLGAPDPLALARRVIAGGMTVRATEALASEAKPDRGKSAHKRNAAAKKDADTRALEADLSRALGLPVEILHKGESGGSLRISYASLDQLDDLCQRLIHG